MLSVCLFVVRCKMLYRSTDMLGLDTFYHCCAHFSGNKRILGIVLEISSAQRISVNIYRRSQPYGDIVFFHFFCTSLSDLLYKCRIPGACKKGRARPCSCVDDAVAADTKSGRSVSSHNRRNSIIRKIAEAEGICNAHFGLAAKKMNQVIIT